MFRVVLLFVILPLASNLVGCSSQFENEDQELRYLSSLSNPTPQQFKRREELVRRQVVEGLEAQRRSKEEWDKGSEARKEEERKRAKAERKEKAEALELEYAGRGPRLTPPVIGRRARMPLGVQKCALYPTLDVLREHAQRPDTLVGGFDSVSDEDTLDVLEIGDRHVKVRLLNSAGGPDKEGFMKRWW